MYQFSNNRPRKRVFRNVSLSNMANVLQRNLRTDRARGCIFRVPGGTNFGNFSARCQPLWRLSGFDECTGLPGLDTSLTKKFNKLNQLLYLSNSENREN